MNSAAALRMREAGTGDHDSGPRRRPAVASAECKTTRTNELTVEGSDDTSGGSRWAPPSDTVDRRASEWSVQILFSRELTNPSWSSSA